MERQFEITMTLGDTVITDAEVREALRGVFSNIDFIRVSHTDHESQED